MRRLYVIDDDEQMRRLLTRQLRAHYDVMCFAVARHFLDVAAALEPGCLVLDVYMPEIGGLQVLNLIAERNLHFPTIIITGKGEVSIAVQAMKAGAVDFIQKPFTHENILESVALAYQCLPSTGSQPEDAVAAKARLAKLSTRETEILAGLVAGLPNKTIAYDLGLSPRTVEAHRARIMSKTEAPSFSALVRLAVAAGVDGKS